MNKLILALSLLLPLSANADEWRTEDTIRQSIFSAVIVADWNQTLQIVDSCKAGTGYYETNPMLTRCPSRRKVNMYFASYLLVNYLTAKYLPANYREVFQYGYIVYEVGTVNSNYKIGLKLKF